MMNQRYMVAGLAVGAMGLIVYMMKKSSSQTLGTSAAVAASSGSSGASLSGLLSSLLGGSGAVAKADVVSIKPYALDQTAHNTVTPPAWAGAGETISTPVASVINATSGSAYNFVNADGTPRTLSADEKAYYGPQMAAESERQANLAAIRASAGWA